MASSRLGADACDLCGSTRFSVIDGINYCENGHEQAGGQQIADDGEEYGIQGKRTIRKKDRSGVKVFKVYRGQVAYKLFLECYQHILWKQCYAMVHKKGLPAELWTVVKDLWTLRLAKQAEKLSSVEPQDQGLSRNAGTSDESEKETSNVPTPPGKKARDSPVLVETIALCYLGILLLRLPIGLGDIYRWIKTEDIPYFRAIRHVPPEMKAHLPGEYQKALDTETILSHDQLQTTVYRICVLYTKEFGMTIPAINSPHLLFQYIRQLALPLEIYPAVKKMSNILNFNFTFTLSSDSRVRRNATSHPEAQLMALVVFATKLGYPFTSGVAKSHPRSLNEPTALRYDWERWVELCKQDSSLAERGSELPLQKGQESSITDADIFKMSNEQLDQYMDWYQQTYTRSHEAEDDINKELLDMFPVKPLPAEDPELDPEREGEETQLNRLKELQVAMKLVRPVSDEDMRQLQLDSETPAEVKRPGSLYLQYRSMEELSLPESRIAKAFYEAAAEAACMSVERLVKAVWQTEAKMDAWKSEKKRAERFGENEPGNKDRDEDTEMIR